MGSKNLFVNSQQTDEVDMYRADVVLRTVIYG
jgi:hypothetical protein